MLWEYSDRQILEEWGVGLAKMKCDSRVVRSLGGDPLPVRTERAFIFGILDCRDGEKNVVNRERLAILPAVSLPERNGVGFFVGGDCVRLRCRRNENSLLIVAEQSLEHEIYDTLLRLICREYRVYKSGFLQDSFRIRTTRIGGGNDMRCKEPIHKKSAGDESDRPNHREYLLLAERKYAPKANDLEGVWARIFAHSIPISADASPIDF